MAKDALEAGGTAYDGGGSEDFTFRWLRMAVTADDPKHVWHAGKGYPGDAFDGFTAHTDAHVWLEARQGPTPDGGGTILAQSEGQHWMQSKEGPLAMIASKNVVFGTGAEAKSGFKLGSAGGVTILADSQLEVSEYTNDPDVTRIARDDPAASTPAEDSAAARASGWATWWTTVDTVAALGLNALDRSLAKALSGSAGPDPSFGTLMTSIGMCANFAGAGANLYGMVGGAAGADTPPGMTVAGEAGICIGSPIAVNVWGAPGALLGSAFATMFGGVSLGALAGVDIGMASMGPVDMSSLVTASLTSVSKLTGVGIELAARKGPFTASGKKGLTLTGGSVTGRATATAMVDSKGWLDLVAPSGAVSFKSQASLSFTVAKSLSMGLVSTIPPLKKVTSAVAPGDKPLAAAPEAEVGQPLISIAAASGVEICSGDAMSAPLLTISAQKVELLVGPQATGAVDAQSVELAVGQSSIKASAESLKIDADGVDFS